MSWLCWYDLALDVLFGIGWSVTLWRWRSCARALHQCQAQRAKLEWKLSIYRKHCEKWTAQ